MFLPPSLPPPPVSPSLSSWPDRFSGTPTLVSSIYHASAFRRFGASVRTYEFGLGPKIPRCSRFTRERAVLFWNESSWLALGSRERREEEAACTTKKTGEKDFLSNFKCVSAINFPSQRPGEHIISFRELPHRERNEDGKYSLRVGCLTYPLLRL